MNITKKALTLLGILLAISSAAAGATDTGSGRAATRKVEFAVSFPAGRSAQPLDGRIICC